MEVKGISIHAPHTGCDTHRRAVAAYHIISIHAPHTGCDAISEDDLDNLTYFNPRTPHGVRPKELIMWALNRRISIHAPHTGCDFYIANEGLSILEFQSTHPTRGATVANYP